MTFASSCRALGLGLSLCSTLCYTPPARACSGPECGPPVRLPELPWLPGNRVYFQVSAQDPGVLTLRTAAGEPIAASIRTLGTDRVFAPEAEVPANTELVLEYREICREGPASVTSTFSLTTMAAAAIELRPAQLTLEEKGLLYDAGGQVGAAFARLRHQGPVANSAAVGLLFSDAWVDNDDHQHMKDSQLEIVTLCPAQAGIDFDLCNPPIFLEPGTHSLEVRTHLVGQATQPEPARLEVDLRCPASTPAPGAGNDAGTTDAGQAASPSGGAAHDDAGSGVQGVQQPEGSDVTSPSPPATSRKAGCALHQPETSARSTVLASLSLALAALGARRRPRA